VKAALSKRRFLISGIDRYWQEQIETFALQLEKVQYHTMGLYR
jgi:hypothetical protein